jgi:hypothetical protein
MSRHERMHMNLSKMGEHDAFKSVQSGSSFNTNKYTKLKISNEEAVKNKKKFLKLKHIQKQMFKSQNEENNLFGKMNKKKMKMLFMANKGNLTHKIEESLPDIDNSNDKAQSYINKTCQSYAAYKEKRLDEEKERSNQDEFQNRLDPLQYDLLKNYLEILNQNKNATNHHNNEQVFASKDDKSTPAFIPSSLYLNNSSTNEVSDYNNSNHPFYRQTPQDRQHLLTVPSHSSNVITPPSSSSSVVSSPLFEQHQSQSNKKSNSNFFYTNQSGDQTIMPSLPRNALNNSKFSNMLTNLNPAFNFHDINADNQLASRQQGLKGSNQLSSQIMPDFLYNLNKKSCLNLTPQQYYETNLNNENRLSMNNFMTNSKPVMDSSECNMFSFQNNNPERERSKCESSGQMCVHKAELTCLRKNLFLLFAGSMPHVINFFNLHPNNIENTTQIDKAINYLVQNQKF